MGGRWEAGGYLQTAQKSTPIHPAIKRQNAWNSVYSLLLVTEVGEEMYLGMTFFLIIYYICVVCLYLYTHVFIYV